MATSKTLTPTNVTIQIPAMTDAPDQSVNSNCIDKLGDAVNTLNSQSSKAGYNMSPWMSSLEDSDNSGYLWAQGNIRIITFQGKRRTHTEDEVLFTLPAEHRPSVAVSCVGAYNGTAVTMRINTDGTCVLFIANGQTATGRIYFSASFMH